MMRITYKPCMALLFLLLLASCSDTTHSSETALSAEINATAWQTSFNGFAVAVVDENQTLYQQGFGLADRAANKAYTEHTIQNIASISKTFVGIALLKAQEMGKLTLDDPIERYLPFKVVNPAFPDEPITLRQLATHTSSIVDNEWYLSKNYYLLPGQDLEGAASGFGDEQQFNPADSAIPMQSFLKNVLAKDGIWNKNSFSAQRPGQSYEYSNVGTALAALVIEQATGQPFDSFTKEQILKPLHMDASGWKRKDLANTASSRLYANPQSPLPFYECATYPDGGLITSISDLSKYLTELIKGYNGKGTILSKESYREYFRPQLQAKHFSEREQNNPYSESYNVGIWMGFGYTGYIGHTGGDPGVVAIMFFDPKKNLGRIMVFNTSITDKAGNTTFYNIWNLLEKYQDKLKP